MSKASEQTKRLLRVTEANIRQSHIYLNGHADMFPSECFGSSSARAGLGQALELNIVGLGESIQTDIPTDALTGKPRGFFRKRAWVRRFFKLHAIQPGDLIAIERVDKYRYIIRPEKPSSGLKAAEFFAGIGLVRLAFERQGWNVIFANDIDPDKAEMYRHNWPNDDHLIVGDIHHLRANDIPSCDLFTASFPCNDLSIAGRWEGLSGKESSSFWGFVRILREMGNRRPPLVLLENVVGFLMSNKGRDFEQALLALNELGYSIDAMILNALQWVPQSRARLFVIAKSDAGKQNRSFALQTEIRPKVLSDFIISHPKIRWAIHDLPGPPKRKTQLAEILEDLPQEDPHWWNQKRAEYFINQLSNRHAVLAKQMIAGRSYSYCTAFRRVRYGKSMAELRGDDVAGCLRTPRGGSGRQILFKGGRGKYQVRLLTARECARLQGVPDSYKINVPLNKALFGFGDAVCVPVVEWIAKHYLSSLAQVLSPSQKT